MNHKPNFTSIVLSALIGITLILSAINPTVAYASVPADESTPPPVETTTPTPTATETPLPTATPVETVPALDLQADPTYIVPGGQVTLVYQISEYEKLSGDALLRFYAPAGLAPVNPEEGNWDETAGTFELLLTAAEGRIVWQADESIAPPVTISAELIQGEEVISKTEVVLDALTEFKIDSMGGEARGINDKVRVFFPGGAISESVNVKITRPSEKALPIASLSGEPFEITAVSEATASEVAQFSKPIEIQVSYDEDELTVGEEELRIVWYDPSDGQWKLPLSQRVDAANNVIIVQTDHFTVFDMYNSGWQSSQIPTMDLFQHSAFTGAATFSYPVKVPPGPSGFQPSIGLSYNSQAVDSTTTDTQASWVGMGWSLDAGGYIERNGFGTWETTDDSYNLTANGMGGALWLGSDGYYHLEDENFARISFDTVHDTWTIKDKQGNSYYFEEAVGYHRTATNGQSCTNLDQTWRWMLTSVVNAFGQTMTYTYDLEQQGTSYQNGQGCTYTVSVVNWVYPETITYANERYQIKFNRANRTDYETLWTTLYQSGTYKTFQKSRLDNIQVKQDADGNGSFETLIRKYQFNYCANSSCNIFPDHVWSAGGLTSTLISVQEFGTSGTNSLPGYSFSYDDDMHMSNASNGYGGGIEFEYDTWHADEGGNDIECNFGYNNNCGWQAMPGSLLSGPGSTGYITFSGDIYKNPGNSFQPGRWYKLEAIVKSSLNHANFSIGYDLNLNGSNPPAYYFDSVSINNSGWQTITSPAFQLPLNTTSIKVLMSSSSGVKVDQFRIVPLPTYARLATRTITGGSVSYEFNYEYLNPQMNTTGNSDALSTSNPYIDAYTEFRGHQYVIVTDPYGKETTTEFGYHDEDKGQPLSVEVKDEQGHLAQSSSSTPDSASWSPASVPQKKGAPATGIVYRFGWIASQTQTIYQANGSTIAGSLTTDYEYENVYGNLVSQTVSGSIPNDLVTEYEYYENTSGDNYIVGLPLSIVTNVNSAKVAETINEYGTYIDSNDDPHDGILFKTRVLMISPDQYSQMSLGYDDWGNVTSLTTYSDYSDGTYDPGSGARAATTVYDSNYHTYLISVTTPPTDLFSSGLTTELTYNYTLGVPTSETDPNGATTSATYDEFGRFTSLTRPDTGDDVSPSMTVSYDTTSSLVVTLTLAIDDTQSYQVVRSYDGLGRPISVTAGGTTTLYEYDIETENNIPYRVDRISTPFAGSESYFWAETKYDALRRPLSVTAPDGNLSTFSYDGFETTVTDANSNETKTTTDVFGRTVSVDAPIGPDITFEYDDLGNLTSATRGSAAVTMDYDLGGRKTGMDDPDMGVWAYTYDALGNLLTQTDARDCTLTLEYDDLNRLDTKTSSGDFCGQQISVDYDYDEGTNGKGRRTSMEDDSGSTSWEYDARGRLMNESKTINGHSAFLTQWTYNSADLPITMTYPDDEVVTYEYNDRMLLEYVSGTNTYVYDMEYDSAGRMITRELGNGLTQSFGYYDWDETVNDAGQGGRLESLTTESLQDLSYVYDSVGNVAQITNSLASETSTYEYDSLNRLRYWTLNSVTEEYIYDAEGNLATKAGVNLAYNDSDHAHAATSAGNNTYGYDDNGNQTTRIVGGSTYELDYDAENRLVSVTGPNNLTATFIYDGDGRRVKSVVNGETVFFAGGHFEFNDTTDKVTKYYFAGASRIAMRQYVVPQTTSLNYLLGDHLGSTSIVTDEVGDLLVETRYKPWGEVRYTTDNETLPTRYTFTGQYSYVDDAATDLGNAGFGLMFYNARWYDPSIGRFAQADTIVPGGVQGLDRFAYTANNPVRYVDPSGHRCVGGEDGNDTEGEDCYEEVNGKPKLINGASSRTRKPPSPPVFVLFCGYDSIPCGGDGALGAYDDGTAIIVDCGKYINYPDRYGSCLADAQQQINDWLNVHPDASFVLVGHSAGADVAILTADWMSNELKLSNNVFSLVILDPVLNGVEDELSSLVSAGYKVVAANSPSYTGAEAAAFLSGLLGENYKYLGLYTYEELGVPPSGDSYLWNAHMALATNLIVCADVIAALGIGSCTP